MRFGPVVWITASLATVGCHTFQPIGVRDLEPDMEVRARVTPSQAQRLFGLLPSEGTRLIDGTVLERPGDSLYLLVPVKASNPWGASQNITQRVPIPLEEVVEVEKKEVDRFSTGLLVVGGGIATGFLLARTVLGGEGGNTPDQEEIPPPIDSIVLLRILLGR